MKKCIKCGSHAFNLCAEGIDQGGFCDVHYWQGRAHRAEAQPAQEPVLRDEQGRPMTYWGGKATPPAAQPAAQQQPLTEVQIETGRRAPWGFNLDAFTAGAKFAEAAHNIGAKP